ncbi:2-oxo-4-hydroxy-4-carboxy-5-ureidoimidazoline decarboxylase [Rhodococcus sovatensis]|uniref:2-oxo-4-hydroxy-4-carboxy-5-ureidoimidazoline decarboxylase n=1 Tax=Rhodococcus sovatensis TaxID=1805840 RepID=A0ABZ2PQS8_9NOCA
MFRNTEFELEGCSDRFNAMSDTDMHRALQLCLDVPRWISAMALARPYLNDDALVSAVFTAADPLTEDEISGALQVHPRIGERPDGDGGHAVQARGEQAGVDITQEDVRRRLRDGNLEYERRFGRVFLIRAAGRDGSEILAALEQRLDNDPGTELRVVERELREIAALRLVRGLADV